jgi:anti-sigma regulatory factor (Ser/Thr protein kinase)
MSRELLSRTTYGSGSQKGGPQSFVVPVRDESDVGSARRMAARVAESCGMSESDAGALALITTEAATNIAKHARDGQILFRDMRPSGRAFVEMIAVDRGNGIADMSRALSDGFSTGGTAGKGLGAVSRMSEEFDIWSAAGTGTVLVARVPIKNGADSQRNNFAVICVPIAGETACGDAWLIVKEPRRTMIVLVDGLGHGADAAVAADAAIDTVKRRGIMSLTDTLQFVDAALRSTRGAAIQIATIDSGAGTITSVGIGNIVTSVVSHAGSKSIPCYPGIVGHRMPRPREVTVPWTNESLLVMHSDGLSAKWNLESYPGIKVRDPALLIAMLFRDTTRPRDDATVLAYRDEAAA